MRNRLCADVHVPRLGLLGARVQSVRGAPAYQTRRDLRRLPHTHSGGQHARRQRLRLRARLQRKRSRQPGHRGIRCAEQRGHKTSSRDQRVLPFKCRQRVRDAVSVYPQRTVLLDVGLLGGGVTCASAPTRCSIHTAKGLVGQAARPTPWSNPRPPAVLYASDAIHRRRTNSARGTTRTPATR